ncbi:hypothetical protein PUN28_015355 [Cardiocondyla obscurior]|uniref:Uncharacterized protein n=1 Tax=Cardiocondyla obscurior TaxID=286306 RepID=A0AAW2EVX9_9HYME
MSAPPLNRYGLTVNSRRELRGGCAVIIVDFPFPVHALFIRKSASRRGTSIFFRVFTVRIVIARGVISSTHLSAAYRGRALAARTRAAMRIRTRVPSTPTRGDRLAKPGATHVNALSPIAWSRVWSMDEKGETREHHGGSRVAKAAEIAERNARRCKTISSYLNFAVTLMCLVEKMWVGWLVIVSSSANAINNFARV